MRKYFLSAFITIFALSGVAALGDTIAPWFLTGSPARIIANSNDSQLHINDGSKEMVNVSASTVPGLFVYDGTGTTNSSEYLYNGVTPSSTTNPYAINGPAASIPSGQTTPAPLSPAYTVAGAAAGNTLHTVIGTCAFSLSTSCTPTAFSNAAAFTSATSYSCSASGGAGTFAQTGALSIGSQSTTGIVITAATSNSQTVTFKCEGT